MLSGGMSSAAPSRFSESEEDMVLIVGVPQAIASSGGKPKPVPRHHF